VLLGGAADAGCEPSEELTNFKLFFFNQIYIIIAIIIAIITTEKCLTILIK